MAQTAASAAARAGVLVILEVKRLVQEEDCPEHEK